jgi:hypothetical protein
VRRRILYRSSRLGEGTLWEVEIDTYLRKMVRTSQPDQAMAILTLISGGQPYQAGSIHFVLHTWRDGFYYSHESSSRSSLILGWSIFARAFFNKILILPLPFSGFSQVIGRREKKFKERTSWEINNKRTQKRRTRSGSANKMWITICVVSLNINCF